MNLVKKGEYARMKGWVPSYVTKLIGAGVIVLTKDRKLVDVEASDRNLAARQSFDRQGVREHHEREREARGTPPAGASAHPLQSDVPLVGAAAPTPVSGGGNKGADFARFNGARAKKEEELAMLAELERLEKQGRLVSVESVKTAAANLGRLLERSLMGISPQLAEKLAGEADAAQCARFIDVEMRRIRSELADAIEQLAAESEANA